MPRIPKPWNILGMPLIRWSSFPTHLSVAAGVRPLKLTASSPLKNGGLEEKCPFGARPIFRVKLSVFGSSTPLKMKIGHLENGTLQSFLFLKQHHFQSFRLGKTCWGVLPSLKLTAKAPENRPSSHKEIHLPTPWVSSGMLVLGRVLPVIWNRGKHSPQLPGSVNINGYSSVQNHELPTACVFWQSLTLLTV